MPQVDKSRTGRRGNVTLTPSKCRGCAVNGFESAKLDDAIGFQIQLILVREGAVERRNLANSP